jgi:hypothetical protein
MVSGVRCQEIIANYRIKDRFEFKNSVRQDFGIKVLGSRLEG